MECISARFCSLQLWRLNVLLFFTILLMNVDKLASEQYPLVSATIAATSFSADGMTTSLVMITRCRSSDKGAASQFSSDLRRRMACWRYSDNSALNTLTESSSFLAGEKVLCVIFLCWDNRFSSSRKSVTYARAFGITSMSAIATGHNNSFHCGLVDGRFSIFCWGSQFGHGQFLSFVSLPGFCTARNGCIGAKPKILSLPWQNIGSNSWPFASLEPGRRSQPRQSPPNNPCSSSKPRSTSPSPSPMISQQRPCTPPSRNSNSSSRPARPNCPQPSSPASSPGSEPFSSSNYQAYRCPPCLLMKPGRRSLPRQSPPNNPCSSSKPRSTSPSPNPMISQQRPCPPPSRNSNSSPKPARPNCPQPSSPASNPGSELFSSSNYPAYRCPPCLLTNGVRHSAATTTALMTPSSEAPTISPADEDLPDRYLLAFVIFLFGCSLLFLVLSCVCSYKDSVQVRDPPSRDRLSGSFSQSRKRLLQKIRTREEENGRQRLSPVEENRLGEEGEEDEESARRVEPLIRGLEEAFSREEDDEEEVPVREKEAHQ